MRYYHTYMPEIWDGMIKNGFIDKDSGIRLNLNWRHVKTKRDFNNIAKKDSELFNIIKDLGLGFYVDRLQGGVEFFEYNPDLKLCETYEELIGDKFLGFQMHEWASNYLGEFAKLSKAGHDTWTKEAIIETYKKFYLQSEMPLIESVSFDELYSLMPPSTLAHLYKNLDYLLKSRCERTGGRLITCDSYALGFDYELKNGVRNVMAEIGGQTEDARLQLAYARGASKAHGKPFGAYYEPWGSNPLSAVRYTADDRSEWQPEGNMEFAYSQGDANSGSTRSLQRRLHFYSYFAGADFMSEEWCANTTFYDWHDFELTPYGKVKKEFIDFTRKFDIGKPITPVAAVLPKDFRFVNAIHTDADFYMNMPIYKNQAKEISAIRKGIRTLFSNDCEISGNEYKVKCGKNKYIIINSPLPDAIDLIHKDSKTLKDYKLTVDLTQEVDTDEVMRVIKDNLPCFVEGNVCWTVTDKRYLLVINNDGAYYNTESGEYTDPSRAHSAKISFTASANPSVVYGEGKLTRVNDSYTIDMPSGSIAIIKF